MINRRLLRVKTMHILYAYFQNERSSLQKSEKELFFAAQKSYDLFHFILLFLVDLSDFAYQKIDAAKAKRIPTEAELNPNMRFVENKLIEKIRINRNFKTYVEDRKVSWVQYREFVKKTYFQLIETDYYAEYMTGENDGFKNDRNFVLYIIAEYLAENEEFYEILEEQSIYWNDDIEFMLDMVVKTLNRFSKKDQEDFKFLPLFKDLDDREFMRKLFLKTIYSYDENIELINTFAQNWDVDRIAFIDMLIIQMAIAEAVEFSSIPVKVSLNEYIELTKYYSTPSSKVFVNGVLDKIYEKLIADKKIVKEGRGKINETIRN